MTMNLLHETVAGIVASEHNPTDIVFIGSLKSGHRCTWEEFTVLADLDYSNDYGAVEIAQDLVIVFSDGQTMWRAEYDGSEWWAFSLPVVIPDESYPIRSLGGKDIMWETLAEINLEIDDE
jgi:hypothetical protein